MRSGNRSEPPTLDRIMIVSNIYTGIFSILGDSWVQMLSLEEIENSIEYSALGIPLLITLPLELVSLSLRIFRRGKLIPCSCRE